jgi:hypothetical protein
MFKRQKGSIAIGFVVLVILFGIAFRAYSFLHQGDPKQGVNSYNPPDGQGLYESCAPDNGSRCFDRLKQIAAGGFTLVLNYDQLYGTAGQQLAYAKQVHSLGMKIIWAMNDQAFWNGTGTDLVSSYSELAATCNCSDNNGFIRYFVGLVKNLPATWGYYIGDEVAPPAHAKLKMFTDLIKQIDPFHPRLFIGDAEDSVSASHGNSPFYDTAEVIGDDHYPVGRDGYTVDTTAEVAKGVQAYADKYGKDSALVLQSFSFAQYPGDSFVCSPFPSCTSFPTKDQMQQMLSLTLRNSHPRLILWFSYYNILRSDNPSGHWADLVAATHANFTHETRNVYDFPSSTLEAE